MTNIPIQSIKDRVPKLTLNRPDSRNVPGLDMSDRLLYALKSWPDNPDVCAVVITGSGKALGAGGDA